MYILKTCWSSYNLQFILNAIYNIDAYHGLFNVLKLYLKHASLSALRNLLSISNIPYRPQFFWKLNWKSQGMVPNGTIFPEESFIILTIFCPTYSVKKWGSKHGFWIFTVILQIIGGLTINSTVPRIMCLTLI